MRNDKENIIVELTFKFSSDVIQYCEQPPSKKKYVISRQLLKSETSIGANAREAQNAESKGLHPQIQASFKKRPMKLSIDSFCLNLQKIILT